MGEKKKKEVEKITTNMMTKSIASILGHDAFTKDVTSALEKDKDVDLLTLLKEDGKKKVEGSSLEEAQRIRRASVFRSLSSSITGGDATGDAAAKKSLVVTEAVKLADTEEAEDAALADDWEQEEFKAGDEVIIVEGENGGYFGTLQHATGGIFGIFDPSVREDEEGNFGVDVHVSPGNDEGFWIHPEAMQHKKYVAGDEVKVIDGINIGRYGTIQSDGNRIRMDDGSYGVDVKMEEKTEEELDLEELDKFEFLPYIPFPGDEMDEALADELNTHEIDVNIKRTLAKSGRVVHRFGQKRHLVRYIHGVLLVKEGKIWNELMPVLKKLAEKK